MGLKVAILGGTGAVGQRFVQLLNGHPWFEIEVITGKTSVGKKYGDAVNWILDSDIPEQVKDLVIVETELRNLRGVDLVFSSLPSGEASIEREIMNSGIPMVSNSSFLRMDPTVPLVIPEVNKDHLALLDIQRKAGVGPTATSPNCTTTMIVLPLKPLDDSYSLRSLNVASYQAVSGAGYPGVPSYDIINNLIPFISEEEEKVERESRKMLGKLVDGKIENADFDVQATCVRVPVLDGHTVAIHAEFEEEVDVEDAKRVLEGFDPGPDVRSLPSSPEKAIIVREERDRPQPRYDRLAGKGMSVSVGRIRRGANKRSLLFISHGHNTIRGAAGGAILLAEFMHSKKFI
ncbi:aspartate-semialdehyde dehydrogenase [Candidatus Korarchaeum cryptofilum]|uniref:Aspartate-semialdehyde dehydrogenase n=1 Tax=Candidatus Korarchaeum cryptofilum TaxID=498846 RepID=A0A3R9PE26_9CREN|nr:aspartate-semialdehyde dehydrogenase [Candidatus Korarchaeum cryptofilum]